MNQAARHLCDAFVGRATRKRQRPPNPSPSPTFAHLRPPSPPLPVLGHRDNAQVEPARLSGTHSVAILSPSTARPPSIHHPSPVHPPVFVIAPLLAHSFPIFTKTGASRQANNLQGLPRHEPLTLVPSRALRAYIISRLTEHLIYLTTQASSIQEEHTTPPSLTQKHTQSCSDLASSNTIHATSPWDFCFCNICHLSLFPQGSSHGTSLGLISTPSQS